MPLFTHSSPPPRPARWDWLERLTLHLKRLTGSMLLAATRPDTLELMLLWEKPAWDEFRKVMEGLYTLEQLGNRGRRQRCITPTTISRCRICTRRRRRGRGRLRAGPCSWSAGGNCGSPAIGKLRSGWSRASAHGDHAVHKVNRWYTVYDVKQIPVGDWLADARKLAAETKLRTWKQMMQRELAIGNTKITCRQWRWWHSCWKRSPPSFLTWPGG